MDNGDPDDDMELLEPQGKMEEEVMVCSRFDWTFRDYSVHV